MAEGNEAMTLDSNAKDLGTTTHWTRIFHVDLFNRARDDDAPQPPPARSPEGVTPRECAPRVRERVPA